MHARTLALATLIAASATLAACSGDNVLGLGTAGGGTNTDTLSNARVRFVNATATSYDIATGGTVGTGNGGIGFGSVSSCLSTNATTPNLSVRAAGTSSIVSGFPTAFQIGSTYTVVAYTSGGTTQFATIADASTPGAGQIGVRVFNAGAAGTSYDVYVTAPGTALSSTAPSAGSVLSGTSSEVFQVTTSAPQQVRVTARGSTSVLLDLGHIAFAAGQNVTLVIAPPASGTTALRGFVVAGC